MSLHELQIHASQAGAMSTSLTIDTLEGAKMLCVRNSRAIVLPDGAMTIENEVERLTVSTLKGVGLNLEMFPREALHLLQDGVITKLRARE